MNKNRILAPILLLDNRSGDYECLMWMLPNHYPREPWEDIVRVLLAALFIFLFFVCPMWMIISTIRYDIGKQNIIFVLPWRH